MPVATDQPAEEAEGRRFTEPLGKRDTNLQYILQAALDVDFAFGVGLAQPRNVAGQKETGQMWRAEHDRDGRILSEVEDSPSQEMIRRLRQSSATHSRSLARNLLRRDIEGCPRQVAPRCRFRTAAPASPRRLRQVPLRIVCPSVSVSSPAGTVFAGPFGVFELGCVVDRHPDLHGQRKSPMNFAECRELLGELGESHPARQIEGQSPFLKYRRNSAGFPGHLVHCAIP